MKILVTILAFIMGGYMLLDGIFVILKGKYIGPEKPGPWANLFNAVNINPMKLGPLFIIYGLLWLCWIGLLWMHHPAVYIAGLVISVLSLWYLPIGTLLSVILLIILLTSRNNISTW